MSNDDVYKSEFYAPWPRLGVAFSKQLNEIRTDTAALAPVIRAVGYDPSLASGLDNLKNAAIQSWEIGEQDFPNKFRTHWNEVDEKYEVQYNSGTVLTPVWNTYLSVDKNGNVSISSSTGITVKQTDGVKSYSSINTVAFNTNDFYIHQNASTTNEASVNLRTSQPEPDLFRPIILIENPTSSEDASWIPRTWNATTVKKVFAAVNSAAGTATVTWSVKYASTRSAAGTTLATGTTDINGTTIITNTVIPINNFIWVETSATSGTPTELNIEMDIVI